MATLSTTSQAQLQDAIDLLLKGTAREMPISEDVIQRIAPVFQTLGVATIGGAYELFRDHPIVSLIGTVLSCSGNTLNQTGVNSLLSGLLLMYEGQAYELPFAEDVIERIAPVAESTGFLSRGGFYEAIKDRPVSTMLQWALFLGKK